MPILTGTINAQGPMIDVKVMPSLSRVEALKKANRPFSASRGAQSVD